jgi:hypothetical protein
METLGKHFRTLTAAAFKSHGFAQADVLARWPEIVGEAIAAAARPERIRWPRTNSGPDNGKATGGGTLFVKAMAGRGLEVQQAVPLIIERINRFLGYGAIMAVKIQQSHEVPEPPPQKPEPAHLSEAPQGIAEPDLAAALQRLGGGVLARSPRSPQGQ